MPKLIKTLTLAVTGMVTLGLGMLEFGSTPADAVAPTVVTQNIAKPPKPKPILNSGPVAKVKNATPTTAGSATVARVAGNHPKQAAVLASLVQQTQPATQSIAATDGSVTALPDAADPTITTVDASTGDAIAIAPSATAQVTATSGLTTAVDPATGAEQITQATPNNGVQILSVGQNAKAAETTSFEVTIPAGTQWVKQSSGALWLMKIKNPGTDPIMVIDAPWAVDANGVSLPTSYAVQGDKITQTVNTKGAAFPVVSDPSAWWWVSTSLQCAAAIAGTVFIAAKIVSVFSKAESIIRASAALVRAYNALGGTMSKVVNVFAKYVLHQALTAAQVAALSALGPNVLSWVFMVTGVGSCRDLVVQIF